MSNIKDWSAEGNIEVHFHTGGTTSVLNHEEDKIEESSDRVPSFNH